MIQRQERLDGIHKDLADIVRKADAKLHGIDLMVVEGLRTIERQKQLVEKGASRTLKSRHLTGHAVDLAPILDGQLRWDWPLFYKIADAMDSAAEELGLNIEWGGRWRTFKDGPHWQLPWKIYP